MFETLKRVAKGYSFCVTVLNVVQMGRNVIKFKENICAVRNALRRRYFPIDK